MVSRALQVMLAIGASTSVAPAVAGVLEVTPILTDVITDSSAATSITVRNRAATTATVQLRLLRWHLEGGQDMLDSTTVAAISPPFITIQPGAVHVVRIVRTSQQALVGEEAYRLLLDELPAPNSSDVAVSLAVRHALPVFFRSPKARPASVRWAITGIGANDTRELIAINFGDRRLRVAQLHVEDKAGHSVEFGEGLAGYALGGSERRWRLPVNRTLDLNHVTVRFVSEAGPETAEALLLDRARP